MKCIFQLVRTQDGFRSDPVACSRAEMADILAKLVNEDSEYVKDSLVLVVVENAGTPEQDISRAPLYRVDSFIRHFKGVVDHVA